MTARRAAPRDQPAVNEHNHQFGQSHSTHTPTPITNLAAHPLGGEQNWQDTDRHGMWHHVILAESEDADQFMNRSPALQCTCASLTIMASESPCLSCAGCLVSRHDAKGKAGPAPSCPRTVSLITLRPRPGHWQQHGLDRIGYG